MMRNGCLTLCQFSIPNDVVSTDYEYAHLMNKTYIFCKYRILTFV